MTAMRFTKLDYCQYLLSSQINYTFTKKGRGQRAEGKIIKNPLGVGLKPTKIIKMYFETRSARNTASLLQSHVFKRGFLLPSASSIAAF